MQDLFPTIDSVVVEMENDDWGITQEEQNESPLAHVLKHATSTNPVLKQAALIYGAVTEVITLETARGPNGATAYFAAFLSSMQQKSKHNEVSFAGLCFLMSQLLPKINNAVLTLKANEAAELYIDILKKHAEVVQITKYLLECISMTLSAMIEKDVNTLASDAAIKMIRTLLVFTVDPRPKIRKEATVNAGKFFRVTRSLKKTTPKPLIEAVVAFCELEISNSSRKDCQGALYLCGLLKQIIAYLPVPSVAKIIGPLMSLAAEGNPYLLLQTFLVINELFTNGFHVSRSYSAAGTGAGAVLQEFNMATSDINLRLSKDTEFVENIILSVADLKPNMNEVGGNIAFCKVYKSGFELLHLLNPAKALSHAVNIFDLVADSITSGKPEITIASVNNLRYIVKLLFSENNLQIALNDAQSVVNVLIQRVISFFQVRYRPALLQVLILAQTLLLQFKVIEKKNSMQYVKLVDELLRVLDYVHKSTNNPDVHLGVEKAIACCVKVMGPEVVLSVLPLALPSSANTTMSVTQQLENSRPWLLLALADHVKNASLSYWLSELLPCCVDLMQMIHTCGPVEGQTLVTIITQIWETLPAFAYLPNDLQTVFKPFAKKMVELMQNVDYQFAQPFICQALKVLAMKNIAIAEDRWGKNNDLGLNTISLEDDKDEEEPAKKAVDAKKTGSTEDNEESDNDDNNEDEQTEEAAAIDDNVVEVLPPISKEEAIENVKVLGAVAKNILPLLFNLASNTEPAQRKNIFDTVLAYSHVAVNTVKAQLFTSALEKYVENAEQLSELYAKQDGLMSDSKNKTEYDEENPFGHFDEKDGVKDVSLEIKTISDTVGCLSDILVSMAPALDEQYLILLIKAYITYFSSPDLSIQKKSYNAVGQILVINQNVFNTTWNEASKALILSSSQVLPPAVRSRLYCALQIYSHLPNILQQNEMLTTLPSILSEAILASKDVNSKTRLLAFEFVVTIGKQIYKESNNNAEMLLQYTYMISAGLTANTPRMKSGTVTMLARVIFEFRHDFPTLIVSELFEVIMPLLQTKTREVMKAVMGYIKVCISALDTNLISPHLKRILQEFSEWPSDMKSRFKRKVRTIFTILIKRFGVDYVHKITPVTDIRLVDYLRKQQLRNKKEKQAKAAAAGKKVGKDEEDMEEEQIKMSLGMSFDQFLANNDDDQDDDEDKLSAADALEMQQQKNKKKGKLPLQGAQKDMWISDNIDFMDHGVHDKIQYNNPKKQNMSDEVVELPKRREAPMTSDGKLNVLGLSKQMAKEEEELKRLKRRKMEHDEDAEAAARKQQRREGQQQFRASQDVRKANALGSKFASVKGAGDAKRKGQVHDPYAYVPLDPRQLNKRKNNAQAQKEAYESAFSDKSIRAVGQTKPRAQRRAHINKREQ